MDEVCAVLGVSNSYFSSVFKKEAGKSFISYLTDYREMREKILQVKTFGSFSMIYDGKSLFGRKVGETQFASMMQMLIHERKKGVSRDRLEQELFGEREMYIMPFRASFTTQRRDWKKQDFRM